ncbi:dUTP diphosphatase [Lentibacillus sp. Marseille-P4043]|uniref:dUTP diphosphatase n=1 Tax=Lentibacillus sp. Marseille-P4043 TaxID=2040293 RepID=UPI000D0AFCDC|nr:dUTP diphosphatase [Lentibacillus sp. Marseille-P4043]
MNLEKLIDMQKALDNRIIEEKGLQGKDLVANTFVALQVELAEFANEGRWFKHWSNDREPRTWYPNEKNVCESCKGEPIFFKNGKIVGQCDDCDGCGVHFHNPLLEEFVDGVHFFLSIAIQKKWEDALYIYEEQLDPDEFDGDLTGYFLEMTYFLNGSYMEKNHDKEMIAGFPVNEYYFRLAWITFLNIGINGFGFTLEQIYNAYLDKNKINHARQVNGY